MTSVQENLDFLTSDKCLKSDLDKIPLEKLYLHSYSNLADINDLEHIYKVYIENAGNLDILHKCLFINLRPEMFNNHPDQLIIYEIFEKHIITGYLHYSDSLIKLFSDKTVCKTITKKFTNQQKTNLLYRIYKTHQWGFFKNFCNKWKWPIDDRFFVRVVELYNFERDAAKDRKTIQTFEYLWGKKSDITCWKLMMINTIQYGGLGFAKYLLDNFKDKYNYFDYYDIISKGVVYNLVDVRNNIKLRIEKNPATHLKNDKPKNLAVIGLLAQYLISPN